MNNRSNDAPETRATQAQQQAHAALDAIERVGARSRLTIRAGIKAGSAASRPIACYGCGPV